MNRSESNESRKTNWPLPRAGLLSLQQWNLRGRPKESWVAGEFLGLSSASGAQVRGQAGVEVIHLSEEARVRSQGLRVGDKIEWFVNEFGVAEQIGLLAPNTGGTEARGRVNSAYSLRRVQAWNHFLRAIRQWFESQGFCEVGTPTLVVCPGTEPTLEAFVTELVLGRQKLKRYLPTSPELTLKKFLSSGWSEIFEIRKCFRNQELTPQHQPEFTMLEWYRAYAGFSQLKEDLIELLESLVRHRLVDGALEPAETWTVADLFKVCAGLDLDVNDLSSAYKDQLEQIWVEKVDPFLAAKSSPVFVVDFHPTGSALARINSRGWADRIELYWRGFEIANGFNELNDPVEQRARFKKDILEKQRLGRSAIELDEEFLIALDRGMPPSVGMALGLERLFMAMQRLTEISELSAFPTAMN